MKKGLEVLSGVVNRVSEILNSMYDVSVNTVSSEAGDEAVFAIDPQDSYLPKLAIKHLVSPSDDGDTVSWEFEITLYFDKQYYTGLKAISLLESMTRIGELGDFFEDWYVELPIEECENLAGIEDEKEVLVTTADRHLNYLDEQGVLTSPGAVISLGAIKRYWNKEHDNDPSLEGFDTFDDWFNETVKYLREYQ